MSDLPDAPLIPLHDETAPSRRLPWPMLLAAALALLLAGLMWMGHELNEGDGAAIDRAILLAMRVPGHPELPAGPAWLPSTARDVTALGSTFVLTLIVALTAAFLLLRRRWRSAALVVAATLLGSITVSVLKAFIARARPDMVDWLMIETSPSFPSGHAANSAIVYLTLATLLFPVVREARLRLFLIGVALALTGAIGLSRIYLGVHWPSDVAGGWAFGGLWAMLWWWIEVRVLPLTPGAPPASAPTPARP